MIRSFRRTPLVAVLLVLPVGALVLGACSSGSGGSDASGVPAKPTVSTAMVPGAATIDSFVVPATVSCPGNATNASFTVTWKVSGATKSVIQVDANPVAGSDKTSGSATAQVHCDPLPHDVVLLATDKNGHVTTERKILNTSGGAA